MTDFSNCTDEDLARQAQSGALEAFEELVSRYEGRVCRFVSQFCRSDADARDVTQDTFVRACQAIRQFDPGQAFAPWLFTIARRKCIDHFRAAPRQAGTQAPEPQDLNDPAELLAQREERQDLWRLARRRLPQAQYQALWLRYAEDLSVAEIARVLRKTRTHVKVLLFRARQTLCLELATAARTAGSRHEGRAPRERGAAAPRPSSLVPRPSTLGPLTSRTSDY